MVDGTKRKQKRCCVVSIAEIVEDFLLLFLNNMQLKLQKKLKETTRVRTKYNARI